MVGGQATPEQVAAQKKQLLASSLREFARLALGFFGSSSSIYPLEFTYAGQAESPDGKADVLDVKGPDGFAAKFFIDGKTHLPLMLTWMDKEPMRIVRNAGQSMGNVQVVQGSGIRPGTPEDAARQQELAEAMKQAEANRRTVEYRIFYADYKTFDGVKLPTRIQRMVDGLPTEEVSLEKVKVNSKISASAFEVVK